MWSILRMYSSSDLSDLTLSSERQILLGRRKPMTMSMKGTGCEDVDRIYMPQDVVEWCTCTYDSHKRTEILRRAGKTFACHGGLLYGVS
jgi:hypothetical protein